MSERWNIEINVGIDELYKKNFWRGVFAEFIGTMFFLLCVTTVALGWGKSNDLASNTVEVGIGIGLSIATLAQAFGHVSGGHLNPAVTWGLMLCGRCSIMKSLLYIVAQVVGGIVGAAITYGCTDRRHRKLLGVNLLLNGTAVGHGFVLEMLFTFILVFFVISITDPKKKVEPYGTTLGIGVCIWVCHVCLIPYTNCGINPARSFGPAVVMDFWKDHWLYWIGPLVGATLAAFLYVFVFYVDEEEKEEKYVNRQPSEVQLQSKVSNA